MERVKGIEPSCPAWEAGVLPLNYTRIKLVPGADLLATICVRVPNTDFLHDRRI